jgi:plasmid stabilization system protein ParE
VKWPRLERGAVEDAQRALEQLALKSPALSRRFRQAFARALSDIAKSPRQFSRLETNATDREIRRVVLKKLDYLIIFKMVHDTPVVVAVMHASQEPDSWRREDSDD